MGQCTKLCVLGNPVKMSASADFLVEAWLQGREGRNLSPTESYVSFRKKWSSLNAYRSDVCLSGNILISKLLLLTFLTWYFMLQLSDSSHTRSSAPHFMLHCCVSLSARWADDVVLHCRGELNVEYICVAPRNVEKKERRRSRSESCVGTKDTFT